MLSGKLISIAEILRHDANIHRVVVDLLLINKKQNLLTIQEAKEQNLGKNSAEFIKHSS